MVWVILVGFMTVLYLSDLNWNPETMETTSFCFSFIAFLTRNPGMIGMPHFAVISQRSISIYHGVARLGKMPLRANEVKDSQSETWRKIHQIIKKLKKKRNAKDRCYSDLWFVNHMQTY